jgi:hypothetical protein
MCDALLDLQSIGPACVLRLKTSVAQEDPDEDLSLDFGES